MRKSKGKGDQVEHQAKTSPWLGVPEIALRYGLTGEAVRNWIRVGVRPARCATAIRLRADRIGGRYMVKRRWLREFLEAIRQAEERPTAAPPVEPADRQQERASAAKQRLQERLGRRKRT